MPLLAQIRWHDDQNPPLSLRPSLRKDETRLDGLSQSDFIRQHRTFRKGRIKGKESSVNLVRIQINLRAGNRTRELLDTVRRAALGQLIDEVFGVISG
jgi:hypothetical protein